MRKIKYILIGLFVMVFSLLQAQVYKTQPLSSEIHTIQINNSGDWLRFPIMEINSDDFIKLNFDRISSNSFNRLRYRIIHCNEDWKASPLSDIQYLEGFNDNPIDDYAQSMNTTVEYTNFNLEIPNRDVRPILSGNYAIIVYEENKPDKILLNACFAIVDPQVRINASVSPNTNIDVNRHHQQVSFTIDYRGLNMRDPLNDLKVRVTQNNRLDNERTGIKPTFLRLNTLTYEQNPNLIFEAGNEYRRFETISHRFNGLNVESILYERPFYRALIIPDKIRANRTYSYDQDQNGRFLVRNHEARDNDTEADYFVVEPRLSADEPLLGNVYINGDFTYNIFSDTYLMEYNKDKKEYKGSVLLKQGAYNYQYLLQSGNKYSPSQTEGNYFEAENEYRIFVYFRPIGQIHDSLVGTISVSSRR